MNPGYALGIGIVLAPFISAILLALRTAARALYRTTRTHTEHPMTTPADEIEAAATKMATFPGPAAEPIAKLLREIAALHEPGCPCRDRAETAVSQAINDHHRGAA